MLEVTAIRLAFRRRRADRSLAKLDAFDARTFGYRPRLGAMGRLGQLQPGWLAEAVAAAEAAEARNVLVPVDLARAAIRNQQTGLPR